jgi:Fe-S-cluster-containing dehydrogenase component/DMSO reductase anchor subunit
MMNDGFIFNHNRCVACGACSAACMLENKWSFKPRIIYTSDSSAVPSLPLINLSLACNHCKKAICMEGCPAAAYYREPATGAVVIDDSKCIGCRYCQWNCPYDAPKYIHSSKVIGKCHLCHHRLTEGLIPACASGCPTGALQYGKLNEQNVDEIIPWFPEKNLEPAVRLSGINFSSTIIVPESAFDGGQERSSEIELISAPEWSLVGFSFLTILSVAQILTALIGGHFPEKLLSFLVIVLAGIISLYHLGKKKRAWRAVINLRSSPLSREIALFIIYFLLATSAIVLQLPVLLILSSLAGLMLLLAIDAVYIFSDKRKAVYLHSGQAFITVLLMVSFLSGKILPFVFIAVIKLTISVWQSRSRDDGSIKLVMSFMRIALLIVTGTSLITGISYQETAVICLFLVGEFFDRILFYIDFKPLNINRLKNSLINQQIEK